MAFFDINIITNIFSTICRISHLMETIEIGMIFSIPIIMIIININYNKYFVETTDDWIVLFILKMMSDYFTMFFQGKITYKIARKTMKNLEIKIKMNKVKCGVPIPGETEKKFDNTIDDINKLMEFFVVLPLLWTTLISFSIAIYNLESNDLPIRSIFTLICITSISCMSYLTDEKLYEKTKSCDKLITNIKDSMNVRMKLSMGCNIDEYHEMRKEQQQQKQMERQKIVIFCINTLITLYALIVKKKSTINTFGSISWLIGALSDNIKGIKNYNYVNDFLDLCESLEKYRYRHTGPTMKVEKINSVKFQNATFGYFDGCLLKNPNQIPRIMNFSFEFKKGYLYYLESPNGIGKSTLLKMFTSNLMEGNVYFGNVNRINLIFEDMQKCVSHIVQASEYTPKFTQKEIETYKGRDKWLEKQLKLELLLNKDTVEMSGGQKKRIFIYIALTSMTPILLLDEILSELSTEETPEVPEGGGWLNRVIHTIVNWHGLKNKITLLIGHGIFDLIPNNENVIKMKMCNQEFQKTRLIM